MKILKKWKNNPVLFVKQVFGVTPEKWQAEALKSLVTHGRVSIRSGHGVGKALRHGTPVLTPNGWKPIEWIKPGDKVIGSDGKSVDVIAVHPQGEREIYKVSVSDGGYVEVDGEHKWFTHNRTERKQGKPGKIRTTKEIQESLIFPNGPREGLNHKLPDNSCVEFVKQNVPIDPYVLGVWVGDGTRLKPQYTGEHKLIENSEHLGGYTYKIPDIREALIELGIYNSYAYEKSIPDIYRYNTREVRLAVLQGLMDTDGTVGDNNACVFTTTSPHLRDHIMELTGSLGGVARVGKVKKPFYRNSNGDKVQGRDAYNITLSLPDDIKPFRLAHKADRYKPTKHYNKVRMLGRFISDVSYVGKDKATCITVANEDGLFYTKDFIITHNSALDAWAVLWFICTHFPCKIPCTAPTSHQLKDILWAEIAKWHRKMPKELMENIEVKQDRVELVGGSDESFAVARTSRKEQPEALQGFHSENLLFIIDEASGIDEVVFEVAEGALSTKGAKVLMTANPTRTSGYFYQSHHKMRDKWKCMRVTCEDSTQVSPEYIEDMATKYGKDSNIYRVRVLGEFPTADEDSLIPLEWVEAAVRREKPDQPNQPIVWGVDVARYGDDRSVLVVRQGLNLVGEPLVWRQKDTMQLAGIIAARYKEKKGRRPVMINVDEIGIGAGVVDRLKELGLPVNGVNVAERPSSNDRFLRLRDELYFRMKEWFEDAKCSIPDHDELIAELSEIKYNINSAGKLQIERKEELKKRGLPSPDIAEALLMTFANEGAKLSTWGKPINVDTGYVV